MTDPNPAQEGQPPINVQVGADVTSFITSLKTAMEQAEAEMQGLDMSAAEQRMDTALRNMANQTVAYANTNNKSLDSMIEKLKFYGVLQEEQAAKMKVFMNQAAVSAGALTREESVKAFHDEIDGIINDAASKMTKGFSIEFANIPKEEFTAINAEMMASVQQSATIFAQSWGESIEFTMAMLKQFFPELTTGIDVLMQARPGEHLASSLEKVMPVSKNVTKEIERIEQLVRNLDEAKLMSPGVAVQRFGRTIQESAKTAGVYVTGKTSGQLFGENKADENQLSVIDKIQARLLEIKQAYIGIAQAQGVAIEQAKTMTVPDVINTDNLVLIDAKMKEIDVRSKSVGKDFNDLNRTIEAAPNADWTREKRQLEDLRNELKKLKSQYDQLVVAKKEVAATGTTQSSLQQIQDTMVIHPSTLMAPPEQLQGRAIEAALASEGIANVEAYTTAFTKSLEKEKGANVDLGSVHGTKMHTEVQRLLNNNMIGLGQEFEKGFTMSWKGFNIKGSMDWVGPMQKVIHDFKAIEPAKFTQLQAAIAGGDFTKLPDDLKAYVAQLELYARKVQQATGKMPELELIQLTPRSGIGSGPDQVRSAQIAAQRDVNKILEGTAPTAKWMGGSLINDKMMQDILKEARYNLSQAVLTPEVQLQKQTAKEAYLLQQQQAEMQKRITQEVNNTVAAEQQVTQETEQQVHNMEEEAAVAGSAGAGGPGVPPNTPPPTTATPPPPEDKDPFAKKWADIAQGKSLEDQYVASLVQERLLEEKLAEQLREKVHQQMILRDVENQKKAIPTTVGLTENEAKAALDRLNDQQKAAETALQTKNVELEGQRQILAVQRERTREYRAQLDLASKEKTVSARNIAIPDFDKLSELSNKLQVTATGATREDPRTKEIKKQTNDLEKQLEVVDAIIARVNAEAVKIKAASDAAAAQLALEKDRLAVLEREAALKEQQYVKVAQEVGTAKAPQLTAAAAEAAQAEQLVTAQQGVVAITEMKTRATQEAAAAANAEVSAMRQQAAAAESVEKAFGANEKATNSWMSKVFSARHVASSFFGMFLSMVGYGVFGKIQEGLANMSEEARKSEENLYALEGALKATQEQAKQGVSFNVEPGTTVKDLVGGQQEMLKWVEEFRQQYQGIWSTSEIESAAANVLNLTRNLEMTKQQFQQLMQLSGVFTIIDTGMQQQNQDLVKGSEYLSRIVQNNIRNTAVTAVGAITPQMQAEKARQLGLQKEWEAYDKLSGAQAANLAMTVNLSILMDKLNGRTDEVNKRLGTSALMYKQASASQQEFAQTSRVGFDVNKISLGWQQAWADAVSPKTSDQIATRLMGSIRSEFEQQIKEGRFGEISDQIYDQLTKRLEQIGVQKIKTNAKLEAEGLISLKPEASDVRSAVEQLYNEYVKALNDHPLDFSGWIGDALAKAGTLVPKKISLPEMDFPSMADSLRDLGEKRLEQREDALANYFRKLRDNGKKYADDLVKFMEDHNDRIVEIADQLREKLADIEEKRQDSIKKAGEDLADRLKEIERKRQEDEVDKKKNHDKDYLEAAIDHQRKLEDLTVDHYRKLKDINDQYLFDLDEAANERNAKQTLQLMRKNKFDIAKENEAYGQRQKDEDKNYARRLEDIARKQAEEEATRKKDYEKQIRDAKEAYEKQLREIEKQRQREIEDAIKARDKEVKKEGEDYEKKKQKRLVQLRDEQIQAAEDLKEKQAAIDEGIDDDIRALTRGWQKKYKLDGDQMKLALDQLKAYYGPGGYMSEVMKWWSAYVANVPGVPGMNASPMPGQVPQNVGAPQPGQMNNITQWLSSLINQPPVTPAPSPFTPIPVQQPQRPPGSGPQAGAMNNVTTINQNQSKTNTMNLNIDFKSDGSITPAMEDKLLAVVTEAINGVRN